MKAGDIVACKDCGMIDGSGNCIVRLDRQEEKHHWSVTILSCVEPMVCYTWEEYMRKPTAEELLLI